MKSLHAMYRVLALVLSVHAGNYDRSPYGKQMCAEFGRQLFGAPEFDAVTLHCHISTKDGQNFWKARHETTLKEQCHKYSRLVRSRQQTNKCVPVTKSELQPMDMKSQIKERIIAAPYCTNKEQPLYQLSITDGKITRYNYLNMSRVRAIGFLSKQKKFIICSCKRRKIVSAPLDKHEQTTSISEDKVIAHALAIDQLREIIFLSISAPFKAVCKLNTDSRSLVEISKGKSPKCLAADSEGRRLYVCVGGIIIVLRYNGTRAGEFVRRSLQEITSLAVSSASSKIYLIENNFIKRMNMNSKMVSRLTQKNRNKRLNIIKVGKRMYVSYSNKRFIDVYKTQKFNSIEKRYHIPVKYFTGFVICHVH